MWPHLSNAPLLCVAKDFVDAPELLQVSGGAFLRDVELDLLNPADERE
jgi:hypothetical protein